MKKIIQYITIMMLVSNVCWGQQFLNGNFNSSGTNWTSGAIVPHYASAYNGNNTYADLTGTANTGSGNGVTISQSIIFPTAGCYMITFDLGTAKDADQPKYYTAGIKTSMIINNVETQLGYSLNINTTGSFDAISWVPQTVGPFYMPAGSATFIFEGDNGYATTGRIMAVDNVKLEASSGCTIPCSCGQWASSINYQYTVPGTSATSGSVTDGETVTIPREATYEIAPNYSCTGNCSTVGYVYTVYNPDGSVLFPASTNFWWATNAIQMQECHGKYKIEIRATCGQQNCTNVFTFYVQRTCPCNCPALPNVFYRVGSTTGWPTQSDCSSNKIINVKCQQVVTVQAYANCQGDGCTQSGVNISVKGPGVDYATGEGDNALAFFANQKGDYVVTTTSTCNGKTCTPCKITFHVEECNCPPPPCCKTPMQVTLNEKDIKFQYAAETRVTIPFQLNGGGKKFTQVRANVVGFDMYSDNQKCVDCFNDSKLWGSIYNGTLSGFNPIYTGKNIGSNVNTREVVFTSPIAQAINTTNLDVKLFLPPAQTLTCCNVYADIYLKISYRDNECNECDTIIPVRVSLLKSKNGQPVDINLPGNPPPGVAKAKSWYVNCCPPEHPWKSWRE